MKKEILDIKNLDISTKKKQIVKNFNLCVKQGEMHVLMGSNGSGKSTLFKFLAGDSTYYSDKGSISYLNNNLLELSPEKRFHLGLFLAFQNPIEIDNLTLYDFLNISFNEKQKHNNMLEISPLNFINLVTNNLKELKMSSEMLGRNLNYGCSGGEKKYNEILQILTLKPNLILLDELDSGLDIDAIKIISNVLINNLQQQSFLVITHSPEFVKCLNPDYIHIIKDGTIVKTGNLELLDLLKLKGYDFF